MLCVEIRHSKFTEQTCPSCWWAMCRCCVGSQVPPTQTEAGCDPQHMRWSMGTHRWGSQWVGHMMSWSYSSEPVWHSECCHAPGYDCAGKPAPAVALPTAHAHILCSPVGVSTKGKKISTQANTLCSSIMENLNSVRSKTKCPKNALTLMTLKLRNLLLSIMILYSSLPSSMMWRSARSEGMFAKIALRHTGSPSWDISIFSSLAVMASYRTIGSSYSSGDVKWSWRKMQIRGWSLLTKQHVIQPSEIVFFFWVKCYLMKFEGHSYSWSNNSIQQVHICEHPLISGRCNAKITLEERMETIQKWLQTVKDTYQSATFIYI